jgi:hypothetical protein
VDNTVEFDKAIYVPKTKLGENPTIVVLLEDLLREFRKKYSTIVEI